MGSILFSMRHLSSLLSMVLMITSPAFGMVDKDDSLYPMGKDVLAIWGVKYVPSLWRINKVLSNCGVSSPNVSSEMSSIDLCLAKEKIENGPLKLQDLAREVSTPVFYVGEQHTLRMPKDFVIETLSSFVDEGFNVLGLEMFNKSSQKDLDSYLAGNLSLRELRQILQEQWRYDLTGYMQIIGKAKFLGMKILALDDRSTGEKVSFVEGWHQRDKVMASVVAQHLAENPDSRILLFTGSAHALDRFSSSGHLPSQREILASEYGIASQGLLTHTLRQNTIWKSLLEIHYDNVPDEFLMRADSKAFASDFVWLYEPRRWKMRSYTK